MWMTLCAVDSKLLSDSPFSKDFVESHHPGSTLLAPWTRCLRRLLTPRCCFWFLVVSNSPKGSSLNHRLYECACVFVRRGCFFVWRKSAEFHLLLHFQRLTPNVCALTLKSNSKQPQSRWACIYASSLATSPQYFLTLFHRRIMHTSYSFCDALFVWQIIGSIVCVPFSKHLFLKCLRISQSAHFHAMYALQIEQRTPGALAWEI